MRSSTWRLEDLRNVILNLGFVGENLHTRQIFDCKKIFDQYPQASVSMTVTPPEGEPYPGTIERDGDLVIWDVRDSDLVAEGDGEIQLVFTQEPHIARSYNARTHICRSQVPTGSIPSGLDDYITRADQLLDQVEDTFPAGGTTGQVLAKKSDTDYDTEWVDQGGGTEDYDELENRPQIGGVTLTGNKTLNDLGAASKADVEAKYTKPATGIPAGDLAAGVIPDPEDLIDDTAGDGDTDKVWSADKSHALLTEINSKADEPTGTKTAGKVYGLDSNLKPAWVDGGGGSVDPQDIAQAVEDWCEENITENPTVVIDTSLLVEGAAADSKAVGVVTNEHATELAMLIDKHEIPPEPPTEIVQVIDLTNATAEYVASKAKYRWINFTFPIEWIGTYYINPTGQSVQMLQAAAYNSNDEHLVLKRNGAGSWNAFSIPEDGKVEFISRREFKTYNKNNVLDYTWTSEDDVAYFAKKGNDNIILAYMNDNSTPLGITYGGSSETYVRYGDSSSEEAETEYEYSYKAEMSQAVKTYFDSNYLDTEPSDNSTNYVNSGGISSALMKDSYNLIDPVWFDWDNPDSGYIVMKSNIYFPVTPGKYLVCNCEKAQYKFYDGTKTQLQTGGTGSSSTIYRPVLVPTGAVYAKVSLNNSEGYIPSNHKVVIYHSDIATDDDQRPYVPHKILRGDRGNGEFFDNVAPASLDCEILKMAQYRATRLTRHADNVVRIASCNLYNPQQPYNFNQIKNALSDYAIDVCGFQESAGGTYHRIVNFLKGWQFPYTSTPETAGESQNPVAMVSQFNIMSSTIYNDSYDPNRKYLKCVIQMPKYGGKVNPTIAIMDYHGTLYQQQGQPASSVLRPLEIAEMLEILEADTSDFKLVLGDTNAYDYTDGYPNNWKQWDDAGFTPVLEPNVITSLEDDKPLDNIFIGAGITCKSAHVIPSEDYQITIGNQTVPMSDHNIVFADLQFDFDSLLDE